MKHQTLRPFENFTHDAMGFEYKQPIRVENKQHLKLKGLQVHTCTYELNSLLLCVWINVEQPGAIFPSHDLTQALNHFLSGN